MNNNSMGKIIVTVMLCILIALAGCGSQSGLTGGKNESTDSATKSPEEQTTEKEKEKMSEEDKQIINGVYNGFLLLAAIPRPSKHEKAISDYLKGWAEEKGFAVKQNEVYDLIFDVPATKNYEDLPLTALQAHMDMVCIGEYGKDYKPETDPITPVLDLENGTLTADGTSLGADDGAGVAMIMSIVEGRMDHGPLRIIFTTDEEIDMTGAMAITSEDLRGVKYLINIDSEESDIVTVSTAADSTIIAEGKPDLVPASGETALRIAISGLSGGHSGVTISDGKCNGIIAVGQTLNQLKETIPFSLASFTGGTANNAIPDKSEAIIVIESKDHKAVEGFIAEKEKQLKESYKGIEESLALSITETDMPSAVLEDSQEKGVLDYVTKSINGPVTMSQDIEGLVESSSNMGIIKVDKDGITIRQMPRSSVGDRLKEIEDYQQKLGEECGLKVTIIEGSRPWPVKEDSKIVPKIQEIYHSLTGEEIKVTALHAALECGAFSELSPELDMASIGPDLTDVHSPGETLYLVSVAKVWHLLEELLTSLE